LFYFNFYISNCVLSLNSNIQSIQITYFSHPHVLSNDLFKPCFVPRSYFYSNLRSFLSSTSHIVAIFFSITIHPPIVLLSPWLDEKLHFYTLDIFARDIAIKRYFDKKIILSHGCLKVKVSS